MAQARIDFLNSILNTRGITAQDAEDTFKRSYPDMTSDEAIKITKNFSKKGGGGGSGTNATVGSGNFGSDLLRSQMSSKGGEMGEFGSLEKGIGIFFDKAGKFRGPLGMLKEMGRLLEDEILIYLGEQARLQTKINEETGMTGKLSTDFRTEIMKASPDVIRLGISFEEMSQAVSDVVAQSGKFKLLSSETIKEMALASKFTTDMKAFGAMGKDFQDVGLGIKDMALMVERMGLKSLGLGLNARTTTKMMDENLKNLNSYGFKNGIEGLNRMTQKSIEFRMNMEDVFKVADKVWDPAGALEMSANLQVMGGAFGALNDPIKMMYMATNDVEGLQDAISGAAKSLVTYNAEQGRFQITGANLRRAKEMADQFGMSMSDLTKNAVAGMERTQAATDLLSTGIQMDDSEKEFLTNLAQMKGGKMVIEVPENLRRQLGVVGDETAIALESMSKDQVTALIEQKKAFEKTTMEDYARQQVTAVENIERDVSYLRAMARVSVGEEIGDAIEKFIGIDQAMISGESKKIFDVAGKWIGTAKGEVKTMIHESNVGPLIKSQKGTVEAPTTSTNLPTTTKTKETSTTPKSEVTGTKNTVDVNVRTNEAALSIMARAMFNDPKFMSDLKTKFSKEYI